MTPCLITTDVTSQVNFTGIYIDAAEIASRIA
jgi:hypothetical protein